MTLATALRIGGAWAGWFEALSLHEHYARNALARGHSSECELVTANVNWPTMLGRPACTCQPTKGPR